MNLCIYESFERIPLGIAVTIEFAGPLAVAVALRAGAWTSRRPRSPRSGSCCSPTRAAARSTRSASRSRSSPRPAGPSTSSSRRPRRSVFDGGRGLAIAMARRRARAARSRASPARGADLLDPRCLAIGCAVALLSSVIPYSLETEALRRLPANVFGVLMSLEPAVAAIAGWVVLGQGLGARDIVAIALVTAASVVVVRAAPPAGRGLTSSRRDLAQDRAGAAHRAARGGGCDRRDRLRAAALARRRARAAARVRRGSRRARGQDERGARVGAARRARRPPPARARLRASARIAPSCCRAPTTRCSSCARRRTRRCPATCCAASTATRARGRWSRVERAPVRGVLARCAAA